jgi:hypothetical protein
MAKKMPFFKLSRGGSAIVIVCEQTACLQGVRNSDEIKNQWCIFGYHTAVLTQLTQSE